MIDRFVETITGWLLYVFRLPELVTILVAMLPIVEVRGAIPIATGYGIPPYLAGIFAFIGSSAIVPLLLLFLLPFIRWLSRTRFFQKVGRVLYEKFEKRSRGIAGGQGAEEGSPADDAPPLSERERKTIEWKKMLGVFVFVAIPLPLTGVWTGSAVAAIVKLKYPKALIAVIAGNFVASSIITLLSWLFAAYINWIILAIGIIAAAVVLTLIVKIIVSKPSVPSQTASKEE